MALHVGVQRDLLRARVRADVARVGADAGVLQSVIESAKLDVCLGERRRLAHREHVALEVAVVAGREGAAGVVALGGALAGVLALVALDGPAVRRGVRAKRCGRLRVRTTTRKAGRGGLDLLHLYGRSLVCAVRK